MIINVYFFETVHLFIECFFRKMFIQFVNIIIDVVHRQRRYGDAARARRRESWSNQKDERCGHDAEELMAPMVTKPTLPDGMCLPTG